MIETVKARYRRNIVTSGMFTLVYHKLQKPDSQDRSKRRGILDLLRPHLSYTAKKIYDDISIIIKKSEKENERIFSQKLGREVARGENEWRGTVSQIQKNQQDLAKGIDKRFSLVLAETKTELRNLKSEIERINRKEYEKLRESEMISKDLRPITIREAGKLIDKSYESIQEIVGEQLRTSANRSIKDVIDRTRREQEYYGRRTGEWSRRKF